MISKEKPSIQRRVVGILAEMLVVFGVCALALLVLVVVPVLVVCYVPDYFAERGHPGLGLALAVSLVLGEMVLFHLVIPPMQKRFHSRPAPSIQ